MKLELELKDLLNAMQNNTQNNHHPYKIGEKYMIRTVTMIQVGILAEVYDKELVIKNASWVADTGRFSEALKTGIFDEVEPFHNDIIVNREAIIEATVVNFELPTEVK